MNNGGLLVTFISITSFLMRTPVLILRLSVVCLILSFPSEGKDPGTRPLNTIALNLYGDASVLSIRYERLFPVSNWIFITGNTGIGFDEPTLGYTMGYNTPPDQYMVTFPHQVTCNIGGGRHFFEFGLGGSFLFQESDTQYFLYPVAGYRMQPLRSDRLNIRLFGVVPFSGTGDEKMIINPVGVSIGFCF